MLRRFLIPWKRFMTSVIRDLPLATMKVLQQSLTKGGEFWFIGSFAHIKEALLKAEEILGKLYNIVGYKIKVKTKKCENQKWMRVIYWTNMVIMLINVWTFASVVYYWNGWYFSSLVVPLAVSLLVAARSSWRPLRKYSAIWNFFLTGWSRLIIMISKVFPCCQLQMHLSRNSALMYLKNQMTGFASLLDHRSSLQFSSIQTMPMI